MPVEYVIDNARRLVMAKRRGVLTDEEVFGYQREVWSRPEVAGYNELMDMTEVEKIVVPSPERIKQLAQLAAAMDSRAGSSKFAIVAPQDVAFGLGRMFEAYRGFDERSTKQVAIFRGLAEALAYLGVEGKP
ncbi:MAG TPA: hypothetical protein VI454_18495 [Verrucomicrobiae bacterium]|jgi:hypothetical protein